MAANSWITNPYTRTGNNLFHDTHTGLKNGCEGHLWFEAQLHLVNASEYVLFFSKVLSEISKWMSLFVHGHLRNLLIQHCFLTDTKQAALSGNALNIVLDKKLIT